MFIGDKMDLVNELTDLVGFLKSSEVGVTEVGISAYGRAKALERTIDVLEKQIKEEEEYIDTLAERYDYVS